MDRRSSMDRGRRRRRHHGTRWCHRHCLWPRGRRVACSFFRLLAFHNRLKGVAGLGHVREVKAWSRLNRWPARAARTDRSSEIAAYLLGLIFLDRAGVRLPRYAQGLQRIQNRPALHFEFSCKIINANFAHPSLFISPCGASWSYQPHRWRNVSLDRYYHRNRSICVSKPIASCR